MPLRFEEVVDRPLFDREFRWQMGVRTLAEADWLQPDDARAADLAEKEVLRRRIPEEVIGWLPGSEPAGDEVLSLVEADLRGRGLAWPDRGRHPIDTAARGVQEDLCLMEQTSQGWVLTAGSVCFPTRWALRDKLGRTLAEIHEPVPGYGAVLGPTVDRFFDRMAPGSLAWRLNWSIVGDRSRRLAPADRQAPSTPPLDPGRDLFVRVERQTLRRLDDHVAICFGIRIHTWSVAEVAAHLDRDVAAAMMRSLPSSVAHYKDLEAVCGPLAEWLETT